MELMFDFSTSVRKALDEIDPKWQTYDGLIVCGTHSPTKHDIDRALICLEHTRKNDIPTLGICFGYQLMAIEYAQNVLKQPDATSEEFGISGEYVVKKREEGLKVGLHDGESWWHNYEVVPEIAEMMEKSVFTDNYFGVQYHPEYQSSKEKPHPLLTKFIDICRSTNADGRRA